MAEKRIRVTLTRSEYRTTVCAGGLPIPNPSNSDLVGEALHAEAEWLKVEFGLDVDADTQESNASNLSDDEWLDLAAASPLAQQLEQAEQRAVLAERQLEAVDKALPPWETERTEVAQAVGVVGRVQTIFNLIADRAALTTPDSATEQEDEDEWKPTFERVEFAPIWSQEDFEKRALSDGWSPPPPVEAEENG